MDNSEIIRYKDRLLSYLKLYNDYDSASGLRKNILLVEGATDKNFINNITDAKTRCIAVADFMKGINIFSTSQIKEPQYNSKAVIITIIQNIAFFPECYDFPQGAEKWPLYGLVDNDFYDEKNYTRVFKLFFTDTHDLETLMLSTDKDLLSRLEQCIITNNDINKAFYIAFQLGEFKREFMQIGVLNSALIYETDGTIDFNRFMEKDKISLSKLLKHININSPEPLSNEKIKKIQTTIIKHMSKQIDANGLWKKDLKSFNVDNIPSFWMNVNGHDILSAICYLVPDVGEIFVNKNNYRKNRDFEFVLSSSYDYDCLRKTKLFSSLQKANLLKE